MHSVTATIRIGGRPSSIQAEAAGTDPSDWHAPEDWNVRTEGGDWIINPPQLTRPGVSRLIPIVDGRPISQVQTVAYPHIHPTFYIAPAELKVLALDVALPTNARIGYVGAGSDNVGTHMRRLVIGTPSLRWRVTDPSAPVTVLKPNSPLLMSPNRIEVNDWQDWDKERGLYLRRNTTPPTRSFLL